MNDPVGFPGNRVNPFPLPEDLTQEQLEADHEELLNATATTLRLCESFLVKSLAAGERRFYHGLAAGVGVTILAFTIAFLLLR